MKMKELGRESPPLSNRGGRDSQVLSVKGQRYERYTQVVIDSRGNILEIPLRRGSGDMAFIDTLSFTFHADAIANYFGLKMVLLSDVDFVVGFSIIAKQIFGFGITNKANHSGGRFYKACWEMSLNGVLYGVVHFGGQNDTMLVELKGKGCEVADDGWESRLFDFLKDAYRVRITRADLARDFYQREITPDSAFEAWNEGKFDKRGKRPLMMRVGHDWDNPTNKGKTLYLGSKESAYHVCIYDKAKEQGDVSADWTRVEVRLNGKACMIPLEVLISPGQFWAGSFPYFETFNRGIEPRTVAKDKRLEMSIEACKRHAGNQAGRAVNMMLAMGMTAQQIVEQLRNKDDLVPARVNPASYSTKYLETEGAYIHDELEDGLSVIMDKEYFMDVVVSDLAHDDFIQDESWKYL